MTYSVSRAVVDAFYDTFARQEVGKLVPLLDDNIEWVVSGPVDVLNWCGTRRGKAAAIDLVDRIFPAQFRIMTFVRSSTLIEDDRVATLNRLTIRRLADGRVISYGLAHFMCFRDDKVVSILSVIDSFDAVEQVLGHALEADADATEAGDLVRV
jgi:ketosteroid isomerase-like protein